MKKVISLKDLQPNNLLLNKTKVEVIRKTWDKGQQNHLLPILISEIDNQLVLIDGHTRTFVAWERGQVWLPAIIKELSGIDNNSLLYKKLHRKMLENDITSICDLAERILEPEDYQKQWVDFCDQLLKKIRE